MDPVLGVRERDRKWSAAGEEMQRCPALQPEPETLASGVGRAVPDLAYRRRLLGAQAVGGISARLAHERCRIECALSRIADDAVRDAVLRITRRDRRFCDRSQLLVADRCADGLVDDDLWPQFRRDEAIPVDRRRADDEPVVFLGEALCGYQSLSAAGGTAVPIRIGWQLAVVRVDDIFGLHSELAQRALREVADQLHVETAVCLQRERASR